ncbi:MAG: hypothetical protein ACYC99_00070 [Candidatus Geothermincolia bacterium]
MDRTFVVVLLVVVVFTGFLVGYSVPPFIQAGVFSGRAEKGVENKIDKNLEQHYKDLYKSDDE